MLLSMAPQSLVLEESTLCTTCIVGIVAHGVSNPEGMQ